MANTETPLAPASTVVASATPTVAPTETPTPTDTPIPAPTADPLVDEWLSKMTVEQKIGQLMMIGFDGSTGDVVMTDIKNLHVGGVIYVEQNITGPQQLAALTQKFQDTAQANGDPPLFIAIDQESGRVSRLTEKAGFTEFPSPMAIAATGNPDYARAVAQAIVDELQVLGINMNLAPDLDVNNNPDNPIIGTRSFGSDPQQVADYGKLFLETFQRNGIIAVGKHFPGHGDTGVDSHVGLPTVPHDLERLNSVELVPFKAAIADGIVGIMTAHIIFPAIDDTAGLPATLSDKVLTGLLRDQLGFKGLIMSDSMEMGALTKNGFPPPIASEKSFLAGADILLYSKNPNTYRKSYPYLLELVKNGAITEARLNESVRRILAVKAQYGLFTAPRVDPTLVAGWVGTAEHKALSREVANAAITLLQDDTSFLPINRYNNHLVVEMPAIVGLGKVLGLPSINIGTSPSDEQTQQVIAKAREGGVTRILIIATTEVRDNQAQQNFMHALQNAGMPMIVVAARSPYDITMYPGVTTYVVTYHLNPPMFDAFANLLRGDIHPRGRTPVQIPGHYEIGDGLQAFVDK
jgi:beta-N-acetylhexosaminidase